MLPENIHVIRYVVDKMTEFINDPELETIEFDFSDSIINIDSIGKEKIEEYISEVPHLSLGIAKYYTRRNKPNKIMFDDNATIEFKRSQIPELRKFANIVVQHLSNIHGLHISV